MDSWKSLLVGIALVALFAYSMLMYGTIIQTNNGVNDSIINSPSSPLKAFNSTVTNNLNDLQVSSFAQKNASIAEQGQLQDPTGALILMSVFKSFGRFVGFIFSFGTAFLDMSGFLINDPMITGVLFAILIIIAVFVFWRFIKWGM